MSKHKKNKKPFKETQFFKVLQKVGPEVLDVATDAAALVFPGMDIVNNIADKAIDTLRVKGGVESEAQIRDIQAAKDQYQREYLDYLKDVADAREMYEKTGGSMADTIAKKVIDWNLWLILALVVGQICVILFVPGQVAAIATGAIGTITGALIQERNTLINFFFGSSHGSKEKDKR